MATMTEELWQGMYDGLRAVTAKRVSDQSHAEDVLQDDCCRIELDRRRAVVGYEVRDAGRDSCSSSPPKACG